MAPPNGDKGDKSKGPYDVRIDPFRAAAADGRLPTGRGRDTPAETTIEATEITTLSAYVSG
jgi:hypothetical protein